MEYLSKTCRACGEDKPITEFYRHRQMLDGHLNVCRDCVRARVAKYREDNMDAIRAYDRRRGLTEKRKAKVRAYSRRPEKRGLIRAANRRWQERNPEARAESLRKHAETHPEKARARNTLANAVRDGKVERKPCWCGAPGQGHHYDYSKPLDVIWLCQRHHGMMHRKHIDPQEFLRDWIGVPAAE